MLLKKRVQRSFLFFCKFVRMYKREALLLFLFFLLGFIPFFLINKGDEIIYINQKRNYFLDIFFQCITFLGESYTFIFAIIYCFFFHKKKFVLYFAAGAIHFAIVQIMKRIIFINEARPTEYLKEKLYLIDGYEHHSWESFPSGHTASAFAFLIIFMYVEKKRQWWVPLSCIALLVGFSRMYLLQHFYKDVYAGMWIGMITSLGVIFFDIIRNEYNYRS